MMRRRLAALAVAGPVAFVALVALLHVLEPETNDTGALSEYALGDYGYLMNVAFVAAGIGFAALAGALAGRVAPTASFRGATVLLLLAAVGWTLLGVGNVDLEGAEQTTSGLIHLLGYLIGFPAMFVGLFLLARAFGRDERWRPHRRTVRILAVAAVVVFGLAFFDVAEPVTMRITVALVMLAVVITAARETRSTEA
jgi:hypothetical protein